MRSLVLFCLVSILLVAGCTAPAPVPPPSEPKPLIPIPQPNCTSFTELIPYIEEECGNVSVTEQICGVRKLPYTATELPIVHICSVDSPCSGNLLETCEQCHSVMTRCVLVIENEDTKKSGTWTVGANFTLKFGGFMKDPKSKEIGPNESFAFDFYQFYDPGSPISTATCDLFITAAPSVEDCI